MTPAPLRNVHWLAAGAVAALLSGGCWHSFVEPPAPAPPPEAPPVTFFGVTDRAYHVVYVIDTTAAARVTFRYVQAELLRSIDALKPHQRFAIVLFGAESPKPMLFEDRFTLLPPEEKIRRLACQFVTGHRERGLADEAAAWRAVRAALEIEGGPPQMIFLLAERPWPQRLADWIADINRAPAAPGEAATGRAPPPASAGDGRTAQPFRARTRINTIAFLHVEAEAVLRQIALQSGGRFRRLDAVDLGKPEQAAPPAPGH